VAPLEKRAAIYFADQTRVAVGMGLCHPGHADAWFANGEKLLNSRIEAT
jgi:hypothetical protein